MIHFEEVEIDCQDPKNTWNINRTYKIIKCHFDNTNKTAKEFIHGRALNLSLAVNPRAANNAEDIRDDERRIQDALGGILAEQGWIHYINSIYGNIASETHFEGSIGQIDIKLQGNQTIEVRSSFPRNGIEFAICNNKYNFKNICTYTNSYKPNEIPKDFFASVLFETNKSRILYDEEIIFYLIGGSTKEMMLSDFAYTDTLVAEDDLTATPSEYKVIQLKNAKDIKQFNDFMHSLGYQSV